MKKLYLKDIAKNLDVSMTAVSLVLNNKGDENKISQETQQRILDYAKANNYVPNQLARGLSRGKTETIGLIIPNISDMFYAKIAGSIEDRAMERGYTVVFSSSNENPDKESRLIKSMLNRQVDGLIIASTQQNSKDIKWLQKGKFPFVLFDRHYPEINTNYVIVDNFGGVSKMTKHLLELGRKRIGFVTILSELDAMEQRFLGYKLAVEGSQGKQQELIVESLKYDNYTREIKNAVTRLVRGKKKVDALVFSTHYLAKEGIIALKELGIKIPQEVAISSFSTISGFDLADPPITAVFQPIQEIAKASVDILIDEIEKKNTLFDNYRRRVLDVKFEIKKSCGA